LDVSDTRIQSAFTGASGPFGRWILVHLEGVRTNRSGYGSVVEIVRKNGASVKRYARGDGGYLAANDPRIHFGLGNSPDIDCIQVTG
jgi:enediyne biosynthesis protein E4